MGSQLDTHRIARLAAAQHGVLDHAQLVACGATPRMIQQRLEAGIWHVVHRGVYGIGHEPLTRDARRLAACRALGRGGVLSDRAAAAMWSVLQDPRRLEVTIASAAGLTHRDEIRVHRRRLHRREWTTVRAIPVTTLRRTLLDLGATATRSALERAFEEAQVRHHLRPAELGADLAARRGHRGSARVRALLLDAVEPGEIESVLELRFLELCAAYALPRPVTQAEFAPWRADFLFPDAQLVVETDGWRFHQTAAARRRDARKTTALEALGLRVLRLTWRDVADEPATTAGRVRQALAWTR
jgi:predicted transcriptional regulator of viral defense system